MFFITSERCERIFFTNIYGWNLWCFRIAPAWPSGFCEPYISTTMRVIIMEHKSKDAHIPMLKLIKFLNQSFKPSEHENYSDNKNRLGRAGSLFSFFNLIKNLFHIFKILLAVWISLRSYMTINWNFVRFALT